MEHKKITGKYENEKIHAEKDDKNLLTYHTRCAIIKMWEPMTVATILRLYWNKAEALPSESSGSSRRLTFSLCIDTTECSAVRE